MSLRVLTLAARATPEDCGIWSASRAIIEAFARHGRLNHQFEVNPTQEDVVASTLNGAASDARIASLHEPTPTWARWIDGDHPNATWFDHARDGLFLGALRGWSARRFVYGRRLRNLKCDLINVPFQGLPFLSHRKPVPYVQFVYDFNQEYVPDLLPARARRWREIGYEGFRRAAALITVGDSVREDAIRFAGARPERVFVAPFGAWPVSPRAGDDELEAVRRRFSLPESFLFYPAPTRPHKNHDTLIRALDLLRRRGLRAHLVTTARQEPHFTRVAALIKDLDLADQVTFTGYVDLPTLGVLYDLATVVVLPTLFEGACGIPLLEAMSKGKAIAASNVCEIPSALGEAGVIFDPLSAREIADSIEILWDDPNFRRILGDAARRRAASRSWSAFTENCERAFEFAAGAEN